MKPSGCLSPLTDRRSHLRPRDCRQSGSSATRGKTADRTVGHLPSQSFRNRSLPVRHSPLLPVKATKLRPLDFDLATVEPDLALRFPPAVRLPVLAPAHGADQRSLAHRIHHLLKRLQAGSQAECPKALRNLASSLTALDGNALDVVSLLMALLFYGVGTRTYRLERATPLLLFQRQRGCRASIARHVLRV